MTSSRDPSALKEREMQAYWKALRAARETFKLKGFCGELDEYRDDIEVIQVCTDWPRLRTMCEELLARDDWFVDPFDNVTADPAPSDPLISSAGRVG